MPTVTTYSPLIPPDKALEQHRSKGRRSSIRAGSPRHLVNVTAADLHAMSLSPPPTPISPMTPMPSTGSKGGKFSPHRLRSNSGLALHTNDDILKQYTDYYPDGTPRISVGLDGTGSLGFMSETRRSSVAVSEAESHTEPPVPSLAGRETFDMVMKNPETANKLWKFADSQGCGHHIEFLAKIRDYTESLQQVVAQVSAISTTYTSVTATAPIALPAPVSKTLNLNIKQLVRSTMPGLDNVFLESKMHVEQLIMRDIFPNFVKQQLALCTSMSMAFDVERSTPPVDFPGLRDSFCLSDPAKAGNPIVCASDSFEQLCGYGRYEVVSRSCGFLQGPHTDRETVMRIRQAVQAKEESVELVLNYRRDGQPFWNMLYLCPLVDAGGRPRLYMGAQVDVSACIESRKDILKILNYNAGEELELKDREKSIERGREAPANAEREESPQTRATKKSFFKKSFKKQTSSGCSPDRSVSPVPPSIDTTVVPRTILTGLSSRADTLHTAYSRFMVLRHVRSFPSPTSPAQMERETAMNRKLPPKLNIAYSSQAVIEILGLGMAADAILHRDVFDVLAEQANSPSVTKSFKSTVRDTVLNDGRTASMELAVSRASSRRPTMSKLVPGTEDGRKAPRGEASTSARSKLGKMMTYWTPMKDADDEVEYVMLVLSPMSVRE